MEHHSAKMVLMKVKMNVVIKVFLIIVSLYVVVIPIVNGLVIMENVSKKLYIVMGKHNVKINQMNQISNVATRNSHIMAYKYVVVTVIFIGLVPMAIV